MEWSNRPKISCLGPSLPLCPTGAQGKRKRPEGILGERSKKGLLTSSPVEHVFSAGTINNGRI